MGKTRKPRNQAQTKKPRGQTRTRKPRAQTRGNSEKKQPDERAGTVNAKPPITIEELRNHLPYAEKGELEGFLKQTERLNALDAYFAEYSEDRRNASARMKKRGNAAKLLDYTRPYRIGLVSNAGAGKSSLVNAMLGKDLALVDSGTALTGSAVEFYQDAASSEKEYVKVSFNDVSDIRRLVERGFENANFNVKLAEDISDSSALVKAIKEAPLPKGHGEKSSEDFQTTKQAVTNLVNQFSEASIPGESQGLGINDKDSIKPFIEEPSQENLQGKSEIVAVKSVSYHIHRDDSDDTTVSLPHGVCLVDMPGIGGGSRHDFIFSEQLDELDAIIFVCSLGQRLPTEESPEMAAIRRFRSLMTPAQIRKNVFLVVNKIDEGGEANNPRLEENYQQLTKLFYGNNPPERSNGEPLFRVSAQGAIVGRKGSLMSDVERASDDEYGRSALALRRAVKGSSAGQEELPLPADVVEWSGVPRLISSLTEFASQQYVVGRATRAKQFIDEIVGGLQRQHQSSLDGLPQSSELTDEDIEKFLNNQVEEAEKCLSKLEMPEDSDLSEQGVWEAIYQATHEALPLVLERHLPEDNSMFNGGSGYLLMQRRFQEDVQNIIWKEAIRQSATLADNLANIFQEQFNKANLQRELITLGLGRKEAEAKFSKEAIEKILKAMRDALKGFCERVAIAHLTDDDVVVTSPESWEGFENLLDGDKTKVEILNSLQGFLEVARGKYEAAIRDRSIPALLAVYKYEQFRVQDACRSLADELFREYRRKFPEDEDLRNVIVSAIQGEDKREKANQAKRTVLKTKLAKLAELAS